MLKGGKKGNFVNQRLGTHKNLEILQIRPNFKRLLPTVTKISLFSPKTFLASYTNEGRLKQNYCVMSFIICRTILKT